MGRRQPRADAPRPRPRRRPADRAGGGDGARQQRLREGLAEGEGRLRLRPGPPLPGGGGAPAARDRAGAVRRPRPVALRRADGRLPARRRRRRGRAGLRRLRGLPRGGAAARRGDPGPPPAPTAAARPLPGRRRSAPLCRRLSERVGLDYAHARLDESLHPFCGGTPTDVRITTFYDEADFAKSLLGVLHETGHALYERGLPPAWARQPVGEAAGMAAHESQSLIVEMQACRSDAFLALPRRRTAPQLRRRPRALQRGQPGAASGAASSAASSAWMPTS